MANHPLKLLLNKWTPYCSRLVFIENDCKLIFLMINTMTRYNPFSISLTIVLFVFKKFRNLIHEWWAICIIYNKSNLRDGVYRSRNGCYCFLSVFSYLCVHACVRARAFRAQLCVWGWEDGEGGYTLQTCPWSSILDQNQ